MKAFTKLLLTASLLSVGFANVASAYTVLRITGSSAYRGAVTNAIGNLLVSSTETAAYVGSSLTGANQQIFHGYLKSAQGGFPINTELYIKTSWTGSLSGLIALTTGANTAQPFLSVPSGSNTVTLSAFAAGAGTSSSGTATGGNQLAASTAPAGDTDPAQPADLAFSDVFQSSTEYTTPVLATANAGGSSLPGVVGVVPFVLMSGVDAGTDFTNINSIQAQELFASGLLESQLTGNSSSTNSVNPVGRDADSGTRFTTFAETGFNPVYEAAPEPVQYAVTTSGSTVSVDEYPADTLFGKNFAQGTQGYSSGSGVATALETPGTLTANDNPGLIIGYVGESDGSNAAKAGATYLSYNGVVYATYNSGTSTSTFNRTLIDQGVYTLWGYEHCYYPSGSAISALGDALATDIRSKDAATAGELISNMVVSRSFEGGPISYTGPEN